MAQLREADWLKLKRVARYLVGAPTLLQVFEWQEAPTLLHIYTDSDWAGNRETDKSTSGGAVTWVAAHPKDIVNVAVRHCTFEPGG